MGLIRLVIFLLILGVVWFMVRNYLNKLRKQQQDDTPPQVARIVKCRHCALHLPENEALQHSGQWFCSQDHKQAYLANKG